MNEFNSEIIKYFAFGFDADATLSTTAQRWDRLLVFLYRITLLIMLLLGALLFSGLSSLLSESVLPAQIRYSGVLVRISAIGIVICVPVLMFARFIRATRFVEVVDTEPREWVKKLSEKWKWMQSIPKWCGVAIILLLFAGGFGNPFMAVAFPLIEFVRAMPGMHREIACEKEILVKLQNPDFQLNSECTDASSRRLRPSGDTANSLN